MISPQQAVDLSDLLTYVNQLDPLVPNNDQNYEVWSHALHSANMGIAKQVVIDYYANVDPHKRDPITPGYIRRQVRRIAARKYRDALKCAEHDWSIAETCTECKSEIAAGTRRPDQLGHETRNIIPPPDSFRRQLRQVLAAKDINQE